MKTAYNIIVVAGVAFALAGFGIPLFWRYFSSPMGKLSGWLLLLAFIVVFFLVLSIGEEMGLALEICILIASLAVIGGGLNWARGRFSKA